MQLTRKALENPIGVAVGVAVVVIFGLYSLAKLPVQLLPQIERPQIAINTSWRAAAPPEVEAQLLEPQEEVLQGLPGLLHMEASGSPGRSSINLIFDLDTDMRETVVDVISRLNRLPPLPADADPPVLFLGGFDPGGNDALIWFFVQLLPGNDRPIRDHHRLLEDMVKARIEAVPGVSGLEVLAGAPEEVQIRFDPYRAAELGIELPQVAAVAGRADDVSGGFVDVGRRQYTLRFAGRYSPEDLSELVLEWRDGRPVHLGDIATIDVRRGDDTSRTFQNGRPALAIRVNKESDANVLEALAQVKAVVEELREPLRAEGLHIEKSFDPSVFIYRAIGLVSGNLGLGILLSVGVLWFFLRRFRATLLVALSIPLAILSTFVVLGLTGRSLNVISLAGLAFAVGMVLDAAIVVLENIVRLRERGKTALEAAAEGTEQVWGALVASTATTVAIFLPVIFLEDVEGQLFADLALTIAIAVSLSLLVAVTVLPAAAGAWLRGGGLREGSARWDKVAERILRFTDTPVRRALWIAGLITVPILVSWLLLPRLDYLPPVKRDAVDAYFSFPPGANLESIDQEIAQVMLERLEPFLSGEREPALKNYYLILFSGGGTLGVRAKDQGKVEELEAIVRDEITAGLPDTLAFTAQGNLFGGFASNRNIDVHLQAPQTEPLLAVGRTAMARIQEVLPGATVRPNPGLELAEPELRLMPDDRRILEVGWTRATLAQVVRALGDGLYVGEHFDGEERMNIILRAEAWRTPEELAALPLATPSGAVLPLGELARVERTVGPSQIRRIDRRRTITLSVTPPRGVSLEEAIDTLRTEVEPVLTAEMPADGAVRYGGSADNLKQAVANMGENFLIALVVLFLLMSALFRSLKDSLLVMLALPLAAVGGVIALRIGNLVTFQPLDLLTMIGFVILLGLVVNNAILLVHQTRTAERRGLAVRDAVGQALSLRLRPIFMSTLTSLFGMLPLALVPGTGAAIYRGLAVVIVGGMTVSTLFTLLLLPCFLRLGEDRRDAARRDEPLHQAA